MRDLLSKKSYISWDKTACLMPNSARRNRGELLPIVNDLLGLTRKVVTRAVSFIDLMKVNFNYDFLKCPSCGGILELTRRYFGLFGARCADEIHQKLATSGFEKN